MRKYDARENTFTEAHTRNIFVASYTSGPDSDVRNAHVDGVGVFVVVDWDLRTLVRRRAVRTLADDDACEASALTAAIGGVRQPGYVIVEPRGACS